jgi:hypothetical protein
MCCQHVHDLLADESGANDDGAMVNPPAPTGETYECVHESPQAYHSHSGRRRRTQRGLFIERVPHGRGGSDRHQAPHH